MTRPYTTEHIYPGEWYAYYPDTADCDGAVGAYGRTEAEAVQELLDVHGDAENLIDPVFDPTLGGFVTSVEVSDVNGVILSAIFMLVLIGLAAAFG